MAEGARAGEIARCMGHALPDILGSTKVAHDPAMHGRDVAGVGHQGVRVKPDPVDHTAVFNDDDFNHSVPRGLTGQLRS